MVVGNILIIKIGHYTVRYNNTEKKQERMQLANSQSWDGDGGL